MFFLIAENTKNILISFLHMPPLITIVCFCILKTEYLIKGVIQEMRTVCGDLLEHTRI